MRIDDDDDADRALQDDIKDQKIAKLSQRVTMISILIPCLIGSIILFIYLDIQSNVTTTFDTESKTVRKLSDTLESRYTHLSEQLQALSDGMDKRLSAIDKSLSELKSKAEQNKKVTDRTRRNTATKKALNAAVGKVDTSLDEMGESIQTLSADLNTVQNALAGELSGLSEAVGGQMGRIEQLGKELSDLSSEKLDKEDLYLILEERQALYRKSVNQQIRGMEEEVAETRKKIRALGRKLDLLPAGAGQLQPSESRPPAADNPAIGTGTQRPPSQTSNLPEAGTIIEQDIE